jgi:hypothetical protein
VFSYIVGDVTIELARMVDLARPGQLLIGDFQVELPAVNRGAGVAGPGVGKTGPVTVDTLGFLDHCNGDIDRLLGIPMSGHTIDRISCEASCKTGSDGQCRPRRFQLTDKHGLSRSAYNLELTIETSGGSRSLGLCGDSLTRFPEVAAVDADTHLHPAGSVREE